MDKIGVQTRLAAAANSLAREKRSHLDCQQANHSDIERPDFIWHYLLQSFATMGGVTGHDGLIKNHANYCKVTYPVLASLTPVARRKQITDTCKAAGIRWPEKKAGQIDACFERVKAQGGPKAAKQQLLALAGRDAKIEFLMKYPGIGEKYSRNMMMDVYHEDFRDSIAIDSRIKEISNSLGLAFAGYEEHEQFYLDVAAQAGLNGWELDRLMFGFADEFLRRLGVSLPGKRRSRTGKCS